MFVRNCSEVVCPDNVIFKHHKPVPTSMVAVNVLFVPCINDKLPSEYRVGDGEASVTIYYIRATPGGGMSLIEQRDVSAVNSQ